MGRAQVRLKEVDISTRVASFEGVYGAMVIPATKGPVIPQLMTSDTQLLKVYTPNKKVQVGYDLSYYSALAYLERANKLWIKRASDGAIYSGMVLGPAVNAALNGSDLIDPTSYVFGSGNVPAVKAVFVGPVAGVIGDVDLIANVAGINGNSILLTGDGVKTLTVLVSDWNTANGSNEVTLNSANGGDVPDDTIAMQLSGGVNEVVGASEAILIHAANGGLWGKDIGIKVATITDKPSLIEPNSIEILVFKKGNEAVALETHLVSRVLGQQDGRGLNMFIEDVLAGSSYIRAISNVLVANDVLPIKQETVLYMGDGSDGVAIGDTQMVAAADAFINPSAYPMTIFMDGGFATPAYGTKLTAICEARQDAVAILSVPYEKEVNASYLTAIAEYRNDELNINSSYAGLYSPHLQIQDKFNNRKLWIAPDGAVGGSISFSSQNYEIWYPPAGFKRGVLNVLDTRVRFSDGDMDFLSDIGVNCIRFISGQGTVVWGQKTLQARKSATDRMNVRLLLIVIEPAIKKFLENFLFDLTDEGNWDLVETGIGSYLRGIQSRKGIYDFDVVCDGSNNTGDDIDANRMNVDVFVKPTRSTEDIEVNIIVTPTSISFSVAANAA